MKGYEEEILRGGQALLGRSSLQAIELETVTPSVLEMLSVHGFVRTFYDPFRRVLSTEPVGMQSNSALFIKNVSCRIGQSPKVRVLDFLIEGRGRGACSKRPVVQIKGAKRGLESFAGQPPAE